MIWKWFQNLHSGSMSPAKTCGIKRRIEGFNRRNIFNISGIEFLDPTQELGLRGGFETTSRDVPNLYFSLRIYTTIIWKYRFNITT